MPLMLMKSLQAFVLSLTLLATGAGSALAYDPWPEEAVEMFGSTPVLYEGRIKPAETVATLLLFELAQTSKLKFEYLGQDYKIGPTEWLMDVLFRPKIGRTHPNFIIDDNAVGRNIDSQAKSKKRARYSYDELFAGQSSRQRLGQKAAELLQRKENGATLDHVEEQLIHLARRVASYESVAGVTLPVQPDNQRALDGPLSEFLTGFPIPLNMEQVESTVLEGPDSMGQAFGEDGRAIYFVLESLYMMYRSGDGMMLFPPQDPESDEWVSTSDLIKMGIETEGEEQEWAIKHLKILEDIAANTEDFDKFTAALTTYHDEVVTSAEARGEIDSLEAELAYNEDYFLARPLVSYLFAFFLISVTWAFLGTPAGKFLSWGTLAMGAIGWLYLTYSIILRVQIRGWAPITNLYETFLFIAWSGFLLCVVVEFMTKRKIALSVGILLPLLCLFLSKQFLEANTDKDTLPPLQAVLRSNFWLSTHVTSITFGYCAGLVGMLVTHFWIIGKTFNLGPQDKGAYRFITGLAYGIVLFSLFFSLIGTILGGIWANYSWGRFWGWDPKENGALMIVLWTLFILHARVSGMIRDVGLHISNVILGCIIAFSWFGVNAMGVGLHSYGFMAGVWKALMIFWGIEVLVISMAIYVKYRDDDKARAKLVKRIDTVKGLIPSGQKKATNQS